MKVSRRWIAGLAVTAAFMGAGVGLLAAWTVGVEHPAPVPHVRVQLWHLPPKGERWT